MVTTSMAHENGIIASILGRQWEIVFKDKLKRLPDGRQARGWCDAPETKSKKISIRNGMDDLETLDTLLHEMLHAAGWHIDEPFVEQFATDAAAILTRLGWRKTEDN